MQAQHLEALSPALDERLAPSAGWFESSFDLRRGLSVTEEAADGHELFRQWSQALSASSAGRAH